MKKVYWILSIIVVLLGVGLVILPEKQSHPDEQMPPDQLMAELYDETRFLTTDDVARIIIEGDPSFLLIDVRSPYDYMDYSLPGSINIPLDELLLEQWKDYLKQDARTLVFFSNGSILAENGWLLAKRTGTKNASIMKGGLNGWIETIIRPVPPPQSASSEAFDQYKFRVAASMYFGGGDMNVQTELDSEPVRIERKQKKRTVEGGC